MHRALHVKRHASLRSKPPWAVTGKSVSGHQSVFDGATHHMGLVATEQSWTADLFERPKLSETTQMLEADYKERAHATVRETLP